MHRALYIALKINLGRNKQKLYICFSAVRFIAVLPTQVQTTEHLFCNFLANNIIDVSHFFRSS